MTEDPDTRLHTALAAGDREGVRAALEAGADVDAPGRHGAHPLHAAVARGDLELVELLLDAGASLETRDDTPVGPLTPLFVAVIYGHVGIARALVDRGASLDARVPALPGDIEVVPDTGPQDPDDERAIRRERAGWSPVHWAASHDDLPMLRVLLEAAPQSLAWKAADGRTPYALVGDRRCRAAMLLVAQGRSPREL